jgi:NTE family protein
MKNTRLRASLMAPWLCGLALALSGCSAFNYSAADAPRAERLDEAGRQAPTIAVVLGSGGPRGYAHVGVINALESAGIVPDMVVGSSVGALIGAFWASGASAETIDTLSREGGPLTLFDINPFADRGWIRGERLQAYASAQLGGKPIEALKRRMVIVATRLQDKQPVLFTHGNLGVAVRASSAVPGIISPVGINGIEHEDADESLPVAVQAARKAGARFVIAVDVSAHDGSAPAGTDAKWLARDAARRLRIAPEVARADFVIHPDLGYLASPRREYFDMARAKGQEAAVAQLPALLAMLRARIPEWKPNLPATTAGVQARQ